MIMPVALLFCQQRGRGIEKERIAEQTRRINERYRNQPPA